MNNDHPIKIIDSFEGRSIDSYHWNGETLICKISEEPLVSIDNETHNYNLHFVIGITNDSVDNHEIEIVINSHPEFKHIIPNKKNTRARNSRADVHTKLLICLKFTLIR